MGEKKQSREIQIDVRENGKADTLRYNICTRVVEEQYDRAIEDLRDFLEAESPFPHFKFRVERYVLHAIDLVNAIRAKRKFPGANFLTMAKQQELNERFTHHFRELQVTLKQIEKVHVELKLNDIRSTVLVVRAVVVSVFVVLCISFALEIKRGLGQSVAIVMDDGLSQGINWVFKKVGR